MYYKNVSCIAKTFYDVEFKPNETKEVPGFINDKYMIVVDALEKPAKQQTSSTAKDNKKNETKEKPAAEKKPSKEEAPKPSDNADDKVDGAEAN